MNGLVHFRRIVPQLLASLPGFLASPSLEAQVTFINVNELPPLAAFNVAGSSAQSLRLQLAVLRFLPAGKSGPPTAAFSPGTTLAAVVASLGGQGSVHLLYSGDRYLDRNGLVAARFDSLERRPAFSLNADANRSLTNRDFGLRLVATTRQSETDRHKLTWDGSLTWSPDLLGAWAGEKYLLFGAKMAQVLKPGILYFQSDDEEEEPRGINLRSLFGRKPKPKPVPPAIQNTPNLSFLVADRKELPLRGARELSLGELAVVVAEVGTDPKQPEFIYLLQQLSATD